MGRLLDLLFNNLLVDTLVSIPSVSSFVFSSQGVKEVGADDGEGPPVPIPNTAVKLTSAYDTWLETARENR